MLMKEINLELTNLNNIDHDTYKEMHESVSQLELLVNLEIARCNEALHTQRKSFFPSVKKVEELVNRRSEMKNLQRGVRKLSLLMTDIHNSLL